MAAYDAFISYSHAKDKPIAAALQSVVQKLGKPWYRRRALRVFRDDTSLSATPSLWPSIERALGQARFLILLASPEAAASAWVSKEVAFWLEHKSADTLLIGVTDGELAWDNSIGDFALHEGKPLPPVLTGRFATEPKWVDLRAYRGGANPRDTKFADLAAAAAATIHGMPKEDLLSQEVRQQRRALTLAWSSFSSLLVLAGALSWQWNNAVEQRNRADSTLAVATKTANTLVFDLAQEFRNRTGMPIDLVHKILDRAQDLQRRLVESGQTTPDLRGSQAVTLLEMATTLLALRDTDGALVAAKQSHDIFQTLLASQPENINLQLNLVLTDDKIGDVFKTQGKYDEVLRSYRHGLASMKVLTAKDPGNTDWQHKVLLIGNKISNVLFLQGDLAGALASSRDSLAIVHALAAKDPANVLWQLGLSDANNVNGDLLRERGDFAGALASYRNGLAITKALAAKDPGNADLQRALSLSENRIGVALAAQGDLAGALAAHRDALVIIKALVTSDPGNAEWQHHVSICDERIGYVLKLQGDLAGALASFRVTAVKSGARRLVDKQESGRAHCLCEV
jgi:tetratricopeptide (TPR) repeat protein